jgi:hypothetical protein
VSDDIHVLPRLAVERLVLEAFLAAGLRVDAAALLAQALTHSDRVAQILRGWTVWTTENCLGCAYTPGNCPFFAAADSREEVHALCASIETEPFTCPVRHEVPGTRPG